MQKKTAARRLLFSADDFGLSVEVNEAIEQAHREGMLSTASLMVAGPAAEDAIKRSRRLPDLNVGLHLVTIEGEALAPSVLTDEQGWLGHNQLKLGIGYFFFLRRRKALSQEIRRQFEAFRKSGLRLDHANAHKHMHLHPTVGNYLISIGREFRLPAVRIPSEPMARPLIPGYAPADHLLYGWSRLLRRQAKKAGLKTNDHCFGIQWSGHMDWEKISLLLPCLPAGSSEIYFHPATAKNDRLTRFMPDYEHQKELEALLHPGLPALMREHGIQPARWENF